MVPRLLFVTIPALNHFSTQRFVIMAQVSSSTKKGGFGKIA
jgi:hypothetical protein